MSTVDGIPLLIEETNSEGMLMTLYHEFVFNPDLPDSLFALPDRAQIVNR
jgi:hypothetical protein